LSSQTCLQLSLSLLLSLSLSLSLSSGRQRYAANDILLLRKTEVPEVLFIRKCGKIWYSRTGHRWQYVTCMLDN
jgi:hypothetical protein